MLASFLVQEPSCTPEGQARVRAGAAQAEAFAVEAAAGSYAAAVALGCRDAEIAAVYLRGLDAAIDAYSQGGSPESLAPVRDAVASLEVRGASLPGPAQIARFVLLAAAAAAQSEREEMALLLDQALRLEALQRAAGQPGAPVIAALEAAGDLWLQVHRYEDARAAYRRAEQELGARPRVTLGLARVEARLKDVGAACLRYRALIDWWGTRTGEPAPLREARAFVREQPCR